MSDKNIYQRLAEVMRAVTYVQKDRKVDTYMAVTYDQVVAACRAELVKAGVLVYPEQTASDMLIKRDVKADVKMHLYSGTYNVHFVNVDKPDDRVTVVINAHANDNGDKAPGKCATYATKTAMLKVLLLETGENDESRAVDSAVDADAVLLEIDAINDVEALRQKYTELASQCIKAKDTETWKSLKAALEVRAKELKS